MHFSLILLLLHLWGSVEVSLSENACLKLPDVPHTQVSEETKKAEYQEGDVIHFTCETGYKSDQTSKYVCTRNGWLTVRQGTCYSCSTLPHVPNAQISEETRKSEYQQGDMIHFTCEAGYTGPTIKYACTSEGWLAILKGKCAFSASGCEPPPADGGFLVKGLAEDSPMLPDHILTFRCEDGKYLNGNSVLICGEDGQWNGPFPSCQDECKVPEIPVNVVILPRLGKGSQVRVGQKLTFSCRVRGHYIQGNEEVECLANGQWSGHFPTCGLPVGCGNPPNLPDGDIISTVKYNYGHNEKVQYTCQALYTMEGEPYKTCTNGRWTGSIRCLRPCTVNRDDMNSHNIEFKYKNEDKLYPPHNDYLTFQCIKETEHDGVVGMHPQCIDGVINLPTCVRIQ